MRGFEEDTVAMWGSLAVNIWRYQHPDSLQQGLEATLTSLK